jgi:hypothetical protein
MTEDGAQQFLSIYDQDFRSYVDAGFQPRQVTPRTKECHAKGWQADVPTVTAQIFTHHLHVAQAGFRSASR